MARAQIPVTVQDPATGNAVSGATVTVTYRSGATTPSVYSSETGGTAGSNVLTTDSTGRVGAKWVERGAYTLTVSGTGITTYSIAWDASPAGDDTIDSAWIGSGQVATTDLASATADVAISTYYSSLPAGTSWTEGKRIHIPNPGGTGVWTLLWSVSSSVWIFTGGAPAYITGASVLNVTSTSTMSQLTGGTTAGGSTASSITLPNKGVYLIEASAHCDASGGTTPGAVFGVGTSASNANTSGNFSSTYGTGAQASPNVFAQTRTLTTTSNAIGMYVRARSGTTGGVDATVGTLKITPVTITP